MPSIILIITLPQKNPPKIFPRRLVGVLVTLNALAFSVT